MALQLFDRVQVNATANTTVSFTLGSAVTGYQSFSVMTDGNTTYYGATDGTNWEVGIGTYASSGSTLTRTTILSSSNSGSAVTFSGSVTVWIDYPAAQAVYQTGSPTFTSVTTPSVTASATDLTLSAISTGAVKFSTLGGLQAQISNVASAVNYFQLSGGATGKAVQFQALGSDTNVSLAIQSKNTGAIDLATGSSGVNISNGNTVTAVTRTATGTGYTSAPTVNIAAPTTAGGVQATATVNMQLNSSAGPTITNGGTGYSVSDVLTVVGGTFTTAAQYTVSSVSSGVITGLTATNQGNYTVLPTNPVSVTGGTGSGASFTITNWGIGSTFTITNAGSGYIEQPTITFSGGGGSSASAYAVIGSGNVVRSLGSNIDFYMPNNQIALRVTDSGLNQTGYVQITNGSTTNITFTGIASIVTASASPINFSTNNNGGRSQQFSVAHTASAVNYVQVTGSATGNPATVTMSAQGSDSNVNIALTPKGSGKIAINAPIKELIPTPITSAATITPTSDTATQYEVSALAVTATIAAPSGTPQDGQKLILRIKDNGTSQTLTWTTTSGAYRAVGTTLPSATTAGKVGYYGCIYNSQDTFWDVVAIAQL